MKQDIFECMPGLQYRPTGVACYGEPFVYCGYDRVTGLHQFAQGAQIGLFARRKSAPASWHIKRGAYCFEFCRSA